MALLSSPGSSPKRKKPRTKDIEEENTTPNWVTLPRDVMGTILSKVGTMDRMKSVEHVCSYWRNICMHDTFMWHTIHVDMRGLQQNLDHMCRSAVLRSHGLLQHIRLDGFATDPLLHYIADNASLLRRMQLLYCSEIKNEAFIRAIKKLPLLEELHISMFGENIKSSSLKAAGKCCPLLRSLKFRKMFHSAYQSYNGDAFAIARNMPNLQHLVLTGNRLNDAGLLEILNGCPLLESLDIRCCYNVNFRGSLMKRCLDQIKEFRFPDEETKYCPSWYVENGRRTLGAF